MTSSSRIIILKIGSSSITHGCERGISFRVLNQLAAAAATLREAGYKVVIVTSGAMRLGLMKLGRETIPNQDTVSFKQALTAVGQIELMDAYREVFKHYDAHVGQVLITHKGLDDTERNETIGRTLTKMFEIGVVPVVNANDTVSSQELVYGDNDSLSARIAVLLKATRLVILSDVDGLYDKDPNIHKDAKLISEVKNISTDIKAMASETGSKSGMGGMRSKIEAAEICMNNKIAVDILSVTQVNKVPEVVIKEARNIGTHFLI